MLSCTTAVGPATSEISFCVQLLSVEFTAVFHGQHKGCPAHSSRSMHPCKFVFCLIKSTLGGKHHHSNSFISSQGSLSLVCDQLKHPIFKPLSFCTKLCYTTETQSTTTNSLLAGKFSHRLCVKILKRECILLQPNQTTLHGDKYQVFLCANYEDLAQRTS